MDTSFVILAAAIGGIVVGCLIATIYIFVKSAGTLVIDTSDPEKDSYRFDINIPLEKLPGRKIIFLRIKVANQTSDLMQE